MLLLNSTQLKLIAQFFSNMSIVWFAAAFVSQGGPLITIRSFINGVVALSIGIWMLRGVKYNELG